MSSKPTTKLFEKLSEIWGWLIIVFAFLAVGTVCTFVSAYLIGGNIGKVVGAVIGLSILCFGIYRATKACRKEGTMYVISRTRATPELDDEPQEPMTK